MTPCSAAAGGSFSSRDSSRSAAFRACSGRFAASIRSRSSFTSACCSSPSPSSSWIAFSCWRRKNSRWPFVDFGLDLGLDLGAELDHLQLAGEDLGEAAQALGDVDLLQQLLLFLGRDPQGAGDQVAERGGVVDVGDRHLQLLGQVGDLLDDLREGALDVAGQRLELGAGLDHVGQLGDPRDEVGLLGDVGAEADPLRPLDEDADRAVGNLEHAGDDADDADLVEVVGPGLLVLGVARGDHRQHPVGAEDVVDQLDRALLPHRQRRERLREGDRLAQRQDRQRVGQRLVRPDRVLDVQRGLDHFQHRRALHQSRPIGTRRVVSAGSRSGRSIRRMPSS